MDYSTPYSPDNHFEYEGNLIYLLQCYRLQKGKETFCNDITINVQQCLGGRNPMPKEAVEELKKYLTRAANEFLYLKFNYPNLYK